MIEYVYNTICILKGGGFSIRFHSEQEIRDVLKLICQFISSNAIDILKMSERETDPEVRLATMILYSSSLFGVSFNVNDILPGTEHPLCELLPRIPFWLTGTGDQCSIVHPEVKYMFLEQQYHLLPTYRILSDLHEHMKHILDIAEMFEYCCATMIVHHSRILKG